MPSPDPEVTIVVVPRERFSCSVQCLDRMYEVTQTPFRLVYVDGRSPRPVRNRLRSLAETHRFELLRSERFLSPNAARNLALPSVHTPYVVFVDNDLLVTPGWLDALLTAAKESGSWAVGPLYFEGDPADKIIHMAGGVMAFSGDPGRRTLDTDHRLQHVRMNDAPELERERCDYVEFHCVLLTAEALERIGPFDERYLATREHLNLCLDIEAAGGEVWFEPASQVTYLSPPPVPLTDIPYFWLRWSDAWSVSSLRTFCDEYGMDPSYVERVSIMRRRRQAVFAPALGALRRVAGDRTADFAARVLRKVEPVGNRLLSSGLAKLGLVQGPSRP